MLMGVMRLCEGQTKIARSGPDPDRDLLTDVMACRDIEIDSQQPHFDRPLTNSFLQPIRQPAIPVRRRNNHKNRLGYRRLSLSHHPEVARCFARLGNCPALSGLRGRIS